MRALDLFCGAGGVSMGLHRAGFDVTGVDLAPQPRYPFRFVQADALRPPFRLSDFDFIWASPPCQAHTSLRAMHNAKEHADLIPQTRALLAASGRPWAIENVPGAPLRYSVMLCGTMFGLGHEGAELRRHRLFETSFPMMAPKCAHGRGGVIGVYGGHVRDRRRVTGAKGRRDHPTVAGRAAMDIDWMTLAELSQAIPPAYSEFIASAAMRSMKQAAA